MGSGCGQGIKEGYKRDESLRPWAISGYFGSDLFSPRFSVFFLVIEILIFL